MPLKIPIMSLDQQRLLDIMLDPQRPALERAKAGRDINWYGDPRSGVGLRPDGLPDIVWCEVPAGEFIMGSNIDSDNPVRKLSLPTFYIAKYPITYKQFQAFIDAYDGFHNTDWWQGLHPEGLKQHEQGPGDQAWKFDNHPRENVSWYDAIAFCRWLSAKLRHEITLPTEEQWEKAARGTDGRVYSYGNTFDANKGNAKETGIGQTSAVGIFPDPQLPYGILDMSGNVWEWMLTEYDNRCSNELTNNAFRVVRGGSWKANDVCAQVAYCGGGGSGIRFNYGGFRVCCGVVPISHQRVGT